MGAQPLNGKAESKADGRGMAGKLKDFFPREKATKERLQHVPDDMVDDDHVEEVPGHPQATVQRLYTDPLDRLRKEGRISVREFDAGDRYREDYHISKLDPGPPSSNLHSIPAGFGPRTPAMYSAERTMQALDRLRNVRRVMPENSLPGAIIYRVIILRQDVADIGRDLLAEGNHRDARKAGTAALRTALAGLAEFYGL